MDVCLASVVCCQLVVSATGWLLVQRSPTKCGLSECDREASIMSRPWRTRRYSAIKKYIGNCIYEKQYEVNSEWKKRQKDNTTSWTSVSDVPYHWVQYALSPETKEPLRQADKSRTSRIDDKNRGTLSVSPLVHLHGTVLRHGDKFIFYKKKYCMR